MNKATSRRSDAADAPDDEPTAEVVDLRRERARRAHPSWRHAPA